MNLIKTSLAYKRATKQLLFHNTANQVGNAQKFIQIRHIRNCCKADPAYGEGVAKALEMTMDEVNNFTDPRL